MTDWRKVLEKRVHIQKLGVLVSDMTDEQLDNYLRECITFELIAGRAPDYFEELSMIARAKGVKRCQFIG